MAKAERFLADAEEAFRGESWDTCVSRCYYAVFHLVAAALADRGGIEQPRWDHKQLHREFLGRFCKLGRFFSVADGKTLQRLRELREAADYQRISLTKRQVDRTLASAQDLCAKIRQVMEDG